MHLAGLKEAIQAASKKDGVEAALENLRNKTNAHAEMVKNGINVPAENLSKEIPNAETVSTQADLAVVEGAKGIEGR